MPSCCNCSFRAASLALPKYRWGNISTGPMNDSDDGLRVSTLLGLGDGEETGEGIAKGPCVTRSGKRLLKLW